MTYDKDNVFAKILRLEIPCAKIFEDEHVIAFDDLNPQAEIHFLVIPKGAYIDIDDFTSNASTEEISALFRAIGSVARMCGLNDGGYRIISNSGVNGGQEVPHLHIHVLGGEPMGKMISK